MSRLVIFDIDGTLTQTSAVDSECYVRAFREVHGIGHVDTDWGAYGHSTDPGIGAELLRRHLRCRDVRRPLEEARRRFVDLISEESRRDARQFQPTAGAAELLGALQKAGWSVAIATGGWRDSALVKLRTAGLLDPDIPAAFADDAVSREGIILTAMARTEFETDVVAYVGDGLWDLRAANNLGIGFVGIGQHRDRLQQAGAAALPDFTRIDLMLDILEHL